MSSQLHIADFQVNDKNYLQYLDLDNDNVYLVDEELTPLLEFTADCQVYELSPARKLIGRFTSRNNHWTYIDKDTGEETIGSSLDLPEGLLDDEVKFSKKWLQAKATA
jgi:uncharacterized protein YchJ